MSEHLTLANSLPMALLCGAVILIVLIQPAIFLKIAYKRGAELGLSRKDMNTSAKTSAIFSIIPSLPIIVSYLLLIPALGRYFPWLRLSVVGSATYETMIANMSAQALGHENIFTANLSNAAFVSVMIIVTIGILGGNIFNVVALKSYDKKVRQLKSKNGAIVPIMTSAMFLGMYGTMSASYLTDFENPTSLVSIAGAGISSLICMKLAKKMPKIKEFSFSICMIMGMISAVVFNLFI